MTGVRKIASAAAAVALGAALVGTALASSWETTLTQGFDPFEGVDTSASGALQLLAPPVDGVIVNVPVRPPFRPPIRSPFTP